MDPELVSRKAPKNWHQPNLQQLDTSDIRCTTSQCSGPTAPHLHQRTRQSHSQQNIKICWWHKTLSHLKILLWSSWIAIGPQQASWLGKQMADELQCWHMCSNAHWSQQHATQLHNGEPTTNRDRRITRSRNHFNPKPQVAETNREFVRLETEY